MTYNQIVEYLNDLDIYCVDNNHGFYDLKNYFKGLNEDLSQQDRQDIKNVIDATRSLPNDKAAETIAAVLTAKNNDTNEALEDDEEEYDKEFFKGADGCYYKKLDCKTVTDYDGFNTDYCLYMKICPNRDGTNSVSFITIFGDSDLYTPDNSDVDFETNNVKEAFEWFDSYNGFDNDIFDDDINESYLTEDIVSTQKQYSHIPEEDFFKLISLDPTYNPERDSVGKYGKWLLGLYKKDNPLNYEAKEIYGLLDTYNKFKNGRKYQIEKDINKFKSIDDIKSAINDVSNSELSSRQKERELRTSKDYDVVYKDKDWTIYVPTTYAGSCTLGKGTRWCTAYSDDDSYYEDYTEEGPLYILINNHDKSEKYQFHFESDSFMDKNDDEIDVNEFFDECPAVKKFFIKISKLHDDSKPYVYEGGEIPKIVKNVVKSIIVSDSVTKLSSECFAGCSLLKSITIPDSVTEIGSGCFYDCTSLESINIPDSVTKLDMHYCFAYCDSLKSITIPNSVTEIGNECFCYCKSLTSITIPNSVTELGTRCFYNCESLDSITIPNSVTEIGDMCFYGCDLLKSITLPNSVTEIGDMCFCYCKSLISITIPNSVTELGAGCFYGCESLNTLITSKGSAAEMYFKENHPKVNIKYSTNESLKEASYGGAYDIEDDMFFTKEELVEFGYDLVDKFSEWANCKADLEDVYMTSPTNLVIEVLEDDDISHQAKVKIDMRKIKSPKDIYKYSNIILDQWKDSYNDYHEYEECLNEDFGDFSAMVLNIDLSENDRQKYISYLSDDKKDIFKALSDFEQELLVAEYLHNGWFWTVFDGDDKMINKIHDLKQRVGINESYSLKEYKDDYIAIANKTSRTNGASALNKDGTIRSVVGRYVLSNIDKDASILDFGAGKDAVQTQALRANGFKNVTAYDFGVNSKDGIHDPNALNKSYDVVFASNVLNVSSDQEMLEETISDIWNACKNGGTIIFNYPGSPRKAGFKADEVENIITSVTGQVPEVVVGPKSTPVWKLVKGAGSRLKEYYDKDKLKLPFRVIVDGTEYTLNFDEVDFILDNLNKVGISINDISEYEVLDSDKDDEFIVTLKNGEKKKFNESVELKESKCHLKQHDKIKNESVTFRDEIPYTYKEMEADLEAGTHGWKKDNFECWVKYKEEFDYAMDILSKHYENVEDFGYDEGYYGLYATKPSIYESLNNRHFSRSLKLLENAGKSLQRSIIKCIDHFIDSNYEYPDGMFLAYSWEDLKDGVNMGLDPEFETSEGILDYFKNIETDFNGLGSKEKDLKDNLVKCMNDYLYKNGYDDRIE